MASVEKLTSVNLLLQAINGFSDTFEGPSNRRPLVFVGITRIFPKRFLRLFADVQSDSFGTRPKKMRISQRLFIRF